MPAVRDLEEALLVGVRAGEGAALVPEELALEQRVGERRAVLGDEALILARARVVDRAGHQVLAGAGLAGDQHGGVRLGHLLHHLEHLVHRRARADDLVEGVATLDLAPQREVLRAQPLVGLRERGGELDVLGRQLVGLERALHVEAHLVGLPGLLDVAVDAPFVDAAHQRADVGVARQQHADGARIALDRLLEELDPADAGQDLIRDDQRDVLALEDREPVLPPRRREDPVVGSEGQLEGFEDGGLVVDDQDAVRVPTGRSARPFDRCKRPGLRFRSRGRHGVGPRSRDRVSVRISAWAGIAGPAQEARRPGFHGS